MSLPLINLLTFVSVAIAVVAVASLASDLMLRQRRRLRERLENELGCPGTGSSRAQVFNDIAMYRAESARFVPALWQRFLIVIQQSGLEIEPRRIIHMSLLAGAGVGLTVGIISRMWLAGLGAFLLAAAIPFGYVYLARQMRINALRMQLPEAFELMSRAVRAGQTVSGAMGLVASESQPPISIEFAYCCEQQNLGLPHDVALQELARRTGVIEIQLFVVAMLIHRSAGGNPIEVLENLSDVIRKRIRLRGKVKAATSEGRLQAVVLTVLPILTFVALLILNPTYAQILLDRPYLLWGVLFSEIAGGLWIRRIVSFEY